MAWHLNRTAAAGERLFESGKSLKSHFSKWNFIQHFFWCAQNFIKLTGYGENGNIAETVFANYFATFNESNTRIVINCVAQKKLMLIIQFVLAKNIHMQTLFVYDTAKYEINEKVLFRCRDIRMCWSFSIKRFQIEKLFGIIPNSWQQPKKMVYHK